MFGFVNSSVFYSSRRGMEVALHGPRPRRVHDLVHEEEEDGPTQPLEQTPQVALGSTRERLFPRRTISSPGSPRYAASATTAPSSCSSSPSSAAIYVWSPLHVPSPSPRAPLAAPLVLPPAQQRLQFRTIRHARRPLWTSLSWPRTFPYGNIQFVRGGLFSGDKENAREPSIIIRLCEKSKRERSTRQRCTA